MGVAVESLERSVGVFSDAGWAATEAVYDPVQRGNIVFLTKNDGSPMIEMVEPVDDASPVKNILKKVGVSAYHFCWQTADLEAAVATLRKKKFVVVVKPVPAAAFDGRRICFMYHRDTGLVELLEDGICC